MAYEDYANFPQREQPAYWTRQWEVTACAQDRPMPDRHGRLADAAQQGLRVRKRHPHGEVIGLVPQGARVSLGKQEQGWGQLTDLHGLSLYPPVADGFVAPSAAIGGWIYLGRENGGALLEEVMAANFILECDCKTRFEKISKIVLLNEGGFVNDANDSGGATNKGIAWTTWQAYAKEDIGVEPTLIILKLYR